MKYLRDFLRKGATVLFLAWPQLALAGSVSGGGGGTLPAQPIGTYGITRILEKAKMEIAMFFNHQSMNSRDMYDPRIYGSDRNIFNILEETDIGIKTDSPCLDLNGEEFDGSIVGPNPNSICISVKNLGEKLDSWNAHAQTVALVAHEMAHKLGLDEKEATDLQVNIYSYFELNHVTEQSASEILAEVEDYQALPLIRSSMTWFLEFAEQADWNTLCMRAKDLNEVFFDKLFIGFGAEGNGPFSILAMEGKKWFWATHLKAMAIRLAACGHADSPLRGHLDEYLYEEYLNAFGTAALLDAKTYASKLPSSGDPNWLPQESIIRKIVDKSVLKEEIREVSLFVSAFDEALEKLKKPYRVISF